jgi:hypothetical protein
MAEKVISPGVFTKEIDQSFLPSAIADIGAAVIGPTVKGPALTPTIVTSYSDFQNKFGDTFKSGSSYYQYLTSHTAEQYLKNNNTLTVVRILPGSYTHASATISSSVDPAVVGKNGIPNSVTAYSKHTGSLTLVGPKLAHEKIQASASLTPIGGSTVVFKFTGSGAPHTNTSTLIHVRSGSTLAQSAGFFRDTINISQSLHGLFITASAVGALVGLTSSLNPNSTGAEHGSVGAFGVPHSAGPNYHVADNAAPRQGGSPSKVYVDINSATDVTGHVITSKSLSGGRDFNDGVLKNVFKLHTHGVGTIMNNQGTHGTGGLLANGTKDNLRFDLGNLNKKKGTFSLTIRQGDDLTKRKKILETYTGLNLDPNSNNYIAKVIGDQIQTVRTDENGKPFLEMSGSYPNKSKYVRVEVFQNTLDYLDENGNVRDGAASASLPTIASGSNSGSLGGSFSGGGDGNIQHPIGAYTYENISENNSQGLDPSTDGAANGYNAYIQALDLLSNEDDYDVNLILTPGIISSVHSGVASKVIDVCEERGDCFAILDPVLFNKRVVDATTEAKTRNSNYAAVYWPWVKIPDTKLNVHRWVPPSVPVAGVYAFNDRVAQPWFAPAGLNRGGIDVASQAERKLTQSDRDTLYDSNVNPIATFPGQGVTVFGQKTLQKKASALDRINVRRLLIKVKKFIASSSRFLVFEQNTAATRRRFLGIVNPYLEQVQSQSGLNAFRVVMDESNNTPDTIDRNQLVGQLFLQPTRTAEFIVLDFVVQPTGASFPE